MMPFPLDKVHKKDLVKITKKLPPVAYARLRQSCHYFDNFAESAQEHVIYSFKSINIFFNVSTNCLDNDVDYIQLPTKWNNIFRSYNVDEFDFAKLIGATHFRKITLTIDNIRNRTTFQGFLSRIPLKCLMLTLNVLADVDLTELIRNLQPQKLCLCYPLKGSNSMRYPSIGQNRNNNRLIIEEVELLTDCCPPVALLNRFLGVKRMILRPRHYPNGEYERFTEWVRRILMNSGHFEHFVLEVRHALSQLLNKPSNYNLILQMCMHREDPEAEPIYVETTRGGQMLRKTDMVMETEGVLGIMYCQGSLGDTKAFLHYLPNATERLPWTLQETSKHSDSIFSFQ